jgi:hypothetical protein
MTRVDGATSTVAGPFGPDSVTVVPETDPTSPNALSLPFLPPWPAAPGVGLAEAVVDEVVGAGLLLDEDDAVGWLDDPQPASDSAVNPARATAAQRDT